MSVTSSKSEGYSSFLNDAAVPSTPLCFLIIIVILYSYNSISGIYNSILLLCFSALFILSLIITILKYRIIFNTRNQILASSAALMLLSSSITFFLNNKITYLISDHDLPASAENISAVIDNIIHKRYSSEIYIHSTENFSPELRGIIYFQGETALNKGDRIFIHKKIYRIALNNEAAFNKHLISQGIHYTAGMAETDITVLKKAPFSIRTYIQNSLLTRIDSLFEIRTAGVVKALLTGNQNYIEKKIILSFRDSGVLHVLSASGLHIAIFAAIPAFFLLPFFRKNTAMSASLSGVLLYLYITDMPVSLIRAVVMFAFLYFQMLLFRNRNVFNYLMLTCSIILCISPWELYSPGFQLSFAATAGILLFYKQYRKSLKGLPGVISDTTAVTLAAQIMTLPIIMFHMNQLNTAGIAANIVIIPLITIIMCTAMTAILLSFIFIPSAVFFGDLTGLLLKLTFLITDFFSNFKLNFYVYDITPALVIIITISLIPLINDRRVLKFRFYPVLISLILCTLYLKKNCQSHNDNYIVKSGNSTAEIKVEKTHQILRLNIQEDNDHDKILAGIKTKNPDIKIIELAGNSIANLAASKKVLNDYAIEEYRFAGIPELNNMFKKIIFQLEKENVVVKFAE